MGGLSADNVASMAASTIAAQRLERASSRGSPQSLSKAALEVARAGQRVAESHSYGGWFTGDLTLTGAARENPNK